MRGSLGRGFQFAAQFAAFVGRAGARRSSSAVPEGERVVLALPSGKRFVVRLSRGKKVNVAGAGFSHEELASLGYGATVARLRDGVSKRRARIAALDHPPPAQEAASAAAAAARDASAPAGSNDGARGDVRLASGGAAGEAAAFAASCDGGPSGDGVAGAGPPEGGNHHHHHSDGAPPGPAGSPGSSAVRLVSAFRVQRPTAHDIVMATARRTTPIPPLDAAVAMALLDLRPGQRVLEVGTGTGATTAGLARAVAPGGMVHTVDRRAGPARTARVTLRSMLGHGPVLDGVVTHVGDMAAEDATHRGGADDGAQGGVPGGAQGGPHETLASERHVAEGAHGGSGDSFGGEDVDPDDVTPQQWFPSRLPGPGPVFDAALIDVPDAVSVLGAVAARLAPDAPVVVYCPNLTQVLAVQQSVVGSHASSASDASSDASSADGSTSTSTSTSVSAGEGGAASAGAGSGGSLLWFDSVTETSARRWLVRPPTLRPDPENGAKHGGFLVVLRRDDRLVMHRPKGPKRDDAEEPATRLFVRGAGGAETPLEITKWD